MTDKTSVLGEKCCYYDDGECCIGNIYESYTLDDEIACTDNPDCDFKRSIIAIEALEKILAANPQIVNGHNEAVPLFTSFNSPIRGVGEVKTQVSSTAFTEPLKTIAKQALEVLNG